MVRPRQSKCSRVSTSTKMPKFSVMTTIQCSGRRWVSIIYQTLIDLLWHVFKLFYFLLLLHSFLDTWRCHLCFAEKFCHSRVNNRLMSNVGSRASGAVHSGKTARQELVIEFRQFHLQWTIHQHSVFTHELVSHSSKKETFCFLFKNEK